MSSHSQNLDYFSYLWKNYCICAMNLENGLVYVPNAVKQHNMHNIPGCCISSLLTQLMGWMLAQHDARATSKNMQMIVTFNSFSDTGFLKFKFLDKKIASCFHSCLILAGNHITLIRCKKFCISQGSVQYFSRVVDKCIRTNVKCLQDYAYQI